MSSPLGTRFTLEVYDPIGKHYRLLWEGRDEQMAWKMLDKPYNQHVTRRLIKTTREALGRRKGVKRVQR